MQNKLVFKQGFYFPIGGRIFASLMQLIAVLKFISSNNSSYIIVGVIFLLMSFIFYGTKGIIIDKNRSTITSYYKYLFVTIGKPVDFTQYMYLSIIKQEYGRAIFRNKTVSVYSPDMKSSFAKYNILLLNDTHRKKVLLSSFDEYEIAKIEAKKVSDFLGFPLVKFDPVRTRKRGDR